MNDSSFDKMVYFFTASQPDLEFGSCEEERDFLSRPLREIFEQYITKISKSQDLTVKNVCLYFESFFEIAQMKYSEAESRLLKFKDSARKDFKELEMLRNADRDKDLQLMQLLTSLEDNNAKIKSLEDELSLQKHKHNIDMINLIREKEKLESQKKEVVEDIIETNSIRKPETPLAVAVLTETIKKDQQNNEEIYMDLMKQKEIFEEYRSENVSLKRRIEALNDFFKVSKTMLKGQGQKNLAIVCEIAQNIVKGESYSFQNIKFEPPIEKQQKHISPTENEILMKAIDDIEREIREMVDLSSKLADRGEMLESKCAGMSAKLLESGHTEAPLVDPEDVEQKKAKYIMKIFAMKQKAKQ